jgi:hypothetical protein
MLGASTLHFLLFELAALGTIPIRGLLSVGVSIAIASVSNQSLAARAASSRAFIASK